MAYSRIQPCTTSTLRSATILAATLVALTLAPPVLAQTPDIVEPTDAQIQLYDKAGEAYNDGQYTKAVELLRSSLALGELNIIYVNLGRALFKLDKCEEALEIYDKALKAPTLVSPTPAQIAAKIEEYKGDMNKECSGTLVIVCDPSKILISIDDKKPSICTGDPIKLKPGTHKLKATLQDKDELRAVTIVALKSHTETIALKLDKKVVEIPKPEPEPATSIWPWVTVGTGGVVLATSVMIDIFVLGLDIDEFELAAARGDADSETLKKDAQSLQTTLIISYIAGALITTGGLVWAFVGTESPQASREKPPQEGIETSIDGWVDDDTAGVQLKMTW